MPFDHNVSMPYNILSQLPLLDKRKAAMSLATLVHRGKWTNKEKLY